MRQVRVLEVGGSLAGAYCGWLFAATGAEVVLLEPPAGGPLRAAPPFVEAADGSTRSAVHEHLNARKRSVVLAATDPRFDDALRWADLIISTCDGDPRTATALHDRASAANPAAVHLVLSGFGLTGPYAGWRNSPLVDWASSGYLYITGDPDREPVQGGGPWPTYLAAVTGAIGAQAALFHAARTGEGQLVDVAAMEAGAAGHQWSLTMYTHTGVVKGRWGHRFGESYHPMSVYECSDGWVCIGAASREQWEHLCIATEMVELLADDDLFAPAVRFERADEIDALLHSWLEGRTAQEVVAILQENRVPASRLLTYPEVLEAEQLATRRYWADRPDLAPAAKQPSAPFASPGAAPFRAAPDLGADTDAFLTRLSTDEPRPAPPDIDLSRVRVVEFGVAWAGPLAGRYLGDLGADVVKVEHPTSRGFGLAGNVNRRGADASWRRGQLPDPLIRAEVYPDADPGERSWNRMGVWNKMNRSKRSLCLDVKGEGGDEVLQRLIASADVLVHNYTPRGAASLGIDADGLANANGRIVSVAMTGYGETGPMASHSSYGPILEAFAGFDEASGYEGEGPMRMGLALPDPVGGLHGAFAVLDGLWERALTDGPVHVDLSQLETLLCFAGEGLLASAVEGRAPRRIGNRSIAHAPQGVYPCGGKDQWVALTVRSDVEWRALLDLLRDPALAELAGADAERRRQLHDVIDERLAAWTRAHSAPQAAALLQRAGVPACPPFTNKDLVEDEHLSFRRFMATFEQPDAGRQTYPGFPIHFGRTAVSLRPAPTLGADNDAVLRSLGYGEAAIQALERAGVIASRPPA